VREYTKPENIAFSALIGAILTMMAMPRITGSGYPLAVYLPATFIAMFLISGAAVAWGKSAGMNGFYPPLSRQFIGVCIAVLISAAAAFIRHFWIDPVLHSYLAAVGKKHLISAVFPSLMEARINLMLWSASFENMFCHAAPVAFFGRLSQSRWIAIGLTVAFRFFIVSKRLSDAQFTSGTLLIASMAGAGAFMCATMFSFFGLMPSMVLAAGLTLHVFF
jgi:hypothetical protein